MIVFKRGEKIANEYSHVECDVPGCGFMSPPTDELAVKNLFERGWFIKNGTHRCPNHFDTGVIGKGPVVRAADGSDGPVR